MLSILVLKNLENSIILCNTPNEIAFIIYSKLNFVKIQDQHTTILILHSKWLYK